MLMFEKVTASKGFDADSQNTVDGMQKLFATKQFMASAYLFQKIFAMTGPLSRVLYGVNIDFGKALNLLDAALEQLSKLRMIPKSLSTLFWTILMAWSGKESEFQ